MCKSFLKFRQLQLLVRPHPAQPVARLGRKAVHYLPPHTPTRLTPRWASAASSADAVSPRVLPCAAPPLPHFRALLGPQKRMPSLHHPSRVPPATFAVSPPHRVGKPWPPPPYRAVRVPEGASDRRGVRRRPSVWQSACHTAHSMVRRPKGVRRARASPARSWQHTSLRHRASRGRGRPGRAACCCHREPGLAQSSRAHRPLRPEERGGPGACGVRW
mmetsp:Transcript_17261/g.52188  ORF Transcript_17261/g.52188 Transcript_17261/m.52188 type:complete len:217 (+) Transcript_17261:622-1272(+)